MHIVRCDDQSYLSFARQLLRSLSNVKNGTVTKHIADATVTVRKVFGHEYVSITKGGGVGYEFFTTGDVYDCLYGLNMRELATSDNYIIPRGYFIRATSNGGATLLLSTNAPTIEDKPVPYVDQKEFFGRKTAVGRAVQVSLITEPVYESSYGSRCESVWSQRPTPHSDYGYDVVGNRLLGFKSTPHVADTDWPRTIATTTRTHIDSTGNKTDVWLMVVVTQTWDVCVYKVGDSGEPSHAHPEYPQLLLTTAVNAQVAKVKIPLPDKMDKNLFSGSARSAYQSNKLDYLEKHRRMCVRINPDCTKLCFTYDADYPNSFIEFSLNINMNQYGEILLSLNKSKSFDIGSHKLRVLDCDYLMPSKGFLKKKFTELGCNTGDLIVLCQNVRVINGLGTFADDNYFYVVNKTTNVVLIEIPSNYCEVNYQPNYGMNGLQVSYTELADEIIVDYMVGNSLPTLPYLPASLAAKPISLFFEFIDLKSLSLSLTVEQFTLSEPEYKSTYAIFIHGKPFEKTGDFDTLFNIPVKRHKWGVHSYEIFTQGRVETVRWVGLHNQLDAELWHTSLDPTHNFVCDIQGNWSYHSFFYRDFYGRKFSPETQQWSGVSWESSCTYPANAVKFKDAFCFDFVVFVTKNAGEYVEKITSHKVLFEKATGLKFNTRRSMNGDKFAWNYKVAFLDDFLYDRGGARGQLLASITNARNVLRKYPVYQYVDSDYIYSSPVVSATGLFA